jgi:hypothetical protein
LVLVFKLDAEKLDMFFSFSEKGTIYDSWDTRAKANHLTSMTNLEYSIKGFKGVFTNMINSILKCDDNNSDVPFKSRLSFLFTDSNPCYFCYHIVCKELTAEHIVNSISELMVHR